jgi:hypothetical protein
MLARVKASVWDSVRPGGKLREPALLGASAGIESIPHSFAVQVQLENGASLILGTGATVTGEGTLSHLLRVNTPEECGPAPSGRYSPHNRS